MIEVRFFATLRENRGKIVHLDAPGISKAGDILQHFGIIPEDVAILLINGRHSKPGDGVSDGDVIALFPPVGGG